MVVGVGANAGARWEPSRETARAWNGELRP